MSKIIYCKKCHKKKRFGSYEEAIEKIGKASKREVSDKCTSSCGLGKKSFFVEIEEELLVADSFENLLNEIEEYNEN